MESTGHERGYAASAQQMYDLSGDWYAGRMDRDWEPPGAEQIMAILARHGLTGEFWTLD